MNEYINSEKPEGSEISGETLCSLKSQIMSCFTLRSSFEIVHWRMVTLSQPMCQNIILNKVNIYLFLALYNFLKYFFLSYIMDINGLQINYITGYLLENNGL